ncbi:hypothetical protein [Paenibacillus apiarius]|uniref:hypothetical protein n=1 Tax=Paenibacillus apiarius TaxID=46240 RepID=UPI003B3ABA65
MVRSSNQVEICIPYRKKAIAPPEKATWKPTGQEGEHNGVNHVEFELLDAGGARISLAKGNVVYIKKNGVELTLDDQETLWFSVENPNGQYQFEVKTNAGVVYEAVLDWTRHVPTP